MQNRSLFVLFACLFLLAGLVPARAQSTAAPFQIGENEVWATDITGDVTMELGGVLTKLAGRTKVGISATIKTGPLAKVILVFSNKARTQLGQNSTLKLNAYKHEMNEPSLQGGDPDVEEGKSGTDIFLAEGEITGTVKLRKDNASNFLIRTPVGAAGIRGTTFRIVYRPPGTGQAFGTFTLTNSDGVVLFSAPASGGGATPGGTPGAPGGEPGAPGGEPGPGQGPGGAGAQPGGPSVSAFGTTQGLDIPAGQQIEITLVSSGGQIVAQNPIGSTSGNVPVPIPPALAQQIKDLSVALVQAVQQVSFPPPQAAPPSSTPSGPAAPGLAEAPVTATAGNASATGIVIKELPPVVPPSNPRLTNP
jgi:hypothetical protein